MDTYSLQTQDPWCIRIRCKHRILDGYVFATDTGSLMDTYSLQNPSRILCLQRIRIHQGSCVCSEYVSIKDPVSVANTSQDPWWVRIRYKHRILDGCVFATNTGSLMDTYSLQTQDPWWIRIHYKHVILDGFVFATDTGSLMDTYSLQNPSRILCL